MPEFSRQQVRQLFMALAELSEAERPAALTRACEGDQALRTELEALLRADRDAGAFLSNPTVGRVERPEPAEERLQEQPGTRIGRYKLLEKIGEGGFGEVWMAEQREPVKRRVALKVIKLGMDTRQVIARFEAERQALALMDHPHIAKVLDAGATERGRPFFVMELVKGVPIHDYCDRERLDTKARLTLFTKVCHAIQHAHQKGIIHRDIKPSNVLVTLHDGVAVPKVIDFGIAKATSSELTTKTLFTEHRQVIGTPAYMSPEQAEMSGLDIDTRSDVYSLGVLLYELLTGTTPFRKDILSLGFEEMLRVIREDEPAKPSTRISTLGGTAARAAQQRRVDVKKLGSTLRGDLDWIVMKCLEKDRSRRYDTANGLAADIERHLANEPVTAGAPSAGYRLRKFVRRNRGKVVAGGLVAVVLMLGVVGTTLGMLRAIDQTARADEEARKASVAAESEARARVAAEENERKAVAAAQRAETAKEEEAKARKRAETIAGFVTTALKSGDAENAGGGQDMTILAAMDNAIRDIDSGRFEDDPETEAQLKGTIGLVLQNNGRLLQAEALFAQALETLQRLHPGDDDGVARALGQLGQVQELLNRLDEAEAACVRSLEMTRRLHEGDHADVAIVLRSLAGVRGSQGRWEESEALFTEALEMWRRIHPGDHGDVALGINDLAAALQAQGGNEEAQPLFLQALEMSQRVHKGDHPVVATAMHNLAFSLDSLGRLDEAERYYLQAVEMNERLFEGDHPLTANYLTSLGLLRQRRGHAAEAEPLLVRALEMNRRLYEGDHTRTLGCLNGLGKVCADQGRLPEAEQRFGQSLDMCRRLYKGDHPSVVMALSNLGNTLVQLGRPAEGEALMLQALEMSQRLHEGDDPEVMLLLEGLAFARNALGRPTEGEALMLQALEMSRRLDLGDDAALALRINGLAFMRQTQGHDAEAEPLFEQALELAQRVHEGDHPNVALCLHNVAFVRVALGRLAQAEPLAVQAVEMNRRLGATDPRFTANVLTTLTNVQMGLGRPAEAEPLLVQLLALSRGLHEGDDLEVAATLFKLGSVRQALERQAEAAPLLAQSLEMRQRLLPADNPDVLMSKSSLAVAYFWLRRFDESIPLLEELLEVREARLGPDDPTTLWCVANLGVNYKDAGRLAEAIPLLDAAYRASKHDPALSWVGPELLDAYCRESVAAELVDPVHLVALMRKHVDVVRAELPEDSPVLARELAVGCEVLLRFEAREAAEALLREALAIPGLYEEGVGPAALELEGTRGLLAYVCWRLGRLDESIPLFEAVLEERAARFGWDASETLMAMANLGVNYEDAGRFEEAIPLLEAAYRASSQDPRLGFAGPKLLAAYVSAADPAEPSDSEQAMALVPELLAAARGTWTEDSPELADSLGEIGLALLGLEAWDEAEPLARECLEIRERTQPDAWQTFDARSALGGALLGQEKLAEAEPLLLDGYRGMKEREGTSGPQGRARVRAALERLVQLCEARGDATGATTWRSQLE